MEYVIQLFDYDNSISNQGTLITASYTTEDSNIAITNVRAFFIKDDIVVKEIVIDNEAVSYISAKFINFLKTNNEK